MAKLKIVRLSQSKNQYGSFSYRIKEGEPEEGTKLYGDNQDIIYSNQMVGIWNQPIEVEHFLGTSKKGKSYSAFSFDKEGNAFQQKGHTAHLAIGAGLDSEKLSMLKLLSELSEQEIKVLVAKKRLDVLSAVPAVDQPSAVSSGNRKTANFEEAVVVDVNTTSKEVDSGGVEADKIKDDLVH